MKFLKKNRVLFILITFVLFIALQGYMTLAQINKMTMTMTLNYKGMEKSLNPDGSKFNVFEMVSNEVLDETIKNANLSQLTVDDIKGRIAIYAKGGYRSVSKVKSAINDNKDYSYVPNEFTIDYSQKNKFSENHTRDILVALSKAYKDYFFKNYVNKNTVLQFEPSQVDDGEYYQIADTIETKIDNMIKYLQTFADENGTFTSDETGYTFANVISMLETLKTSDVEKYRAYIVHSSLSKNKTDLIARLNYNNTKLDKSYRKSVEENLFIQGAIEKYRRYVTRVVFIPSYDIQRDFYMSRTKTGIDYLTKDAYDSAMTADGISKRIEYNNYILSKYDNKTVSDPTKEEYAQEMLTQLIASLENLSKIAVATDNDYMVYKSSDYVNFRIPTSHLSGLINVKQFGQNFLMSAAVALLAVLARYKYAQLTENEAEETAEKEDEEE